MDMWAERNMEQIAAAERLTNNQALFINSHGKGGQGASGTGLAFILMRRL